MTNTNCTHPRQDAILDPQTNAKLWICKDCGELVEAETQTLRFDHTTCTTCGYSAGEGNGWFGPSSECADCRQASNRAANGWTPENSVD